MQAAVCPINPFSGCAGSAQAFLCLLAGVLPSQCLRSPGLGWVLCSHNGIKALPTCSASQVSGHSASQHLCSRQWYSCGCFKDEVQKPALHAPPQGTWAYGWPPSALHASHRCFLQPGGQSQHHSSFFVKVVFFLWAYYGSLNNFY